MLDKKISNWTCYTSHIARRTFAFALLLLFFGKVLYSQASEDVNEQHGLCYAWILGTGKEKEATGTLTQSYHSILEDAEQRLIQSAQRYGITQDDVLVVAGKYLYSGDVNESWRLACETLGVHP